MNNYNLVIYEFEELYKILVEIKKDINLSFERVNKQKLPDLNSKINYLVFTKKEIPGLNNQIVFNDFPIPIFKLLEKINIEFIKKKFKGKLPKILYGGSVNPENIRNLKKITNLDGFLIGGASQNSKKFIDIVKKTYN